VKKGTGHSKYERGNMIRLPTFSILLLDNTKEDSYGSLRMSLDRACYFSNLFLRKIKILLAMVIVKKV
jgi:hypothetical protein